MAALVLNLFGGFEVCLTSGAPLAISTKAGQAMMAYLALSPHQRHSREKLAALLWEDRLDQQARSSLRQTLTTLRKTTPSTDRPWLLTGSEWVALDRDLVEADVTIFEDLATRATAESLAHAADLYRGDLL